MGRDHTCEILSEGEHALPQHAGWPKDRSRAEVYEQLKRDLEYQLYDARSIVSSYAQLQPLVKAQAEVGVPV